MINLTRLILWVVGALLLSASVCSARPVSLEGVWRCGFDPSDSGERQQWFNHRLQMPIRLPGTLQAQNIGLPITTGTPWILSLYNRYWYLRDDYKNYTDVGKVKVPFLSQPQRHYLGVACYQRHIDILQYQA